MLGPLAVAARRECPAWSPSARRTGSTGGLCLQCQRCRAGPSSLGARLGAGGAGERTAEWAGRVLFLPVAAGLTDHTVTLAAGVGQAPQEAVKCVG